MAQQPLDSGTVKRNRWVAFGIMLLPLFVIIAASLLWIAVKNGHIDIVGNLGTHNNGTLMQPVRELDSIALFDADGAPFVYAQQPAKWTLLIPGSDVCDDACLQTLWLTRQLHTALGRRAAHLRRAYLSDSWPLAPEFAQFLLAEQPKLQLLHGQSSDIDGLLVASGDSLPSLQPNLYYLVDKRGFIMMVYGPDNTGKDVIGDLKFLMKQVGDE
jgi:hypothetical protein